MARSTPARYSSWSNRRFMLQAVLLYVMQRIKCQYIKTYHAHKQKVFKFDESQIIPDILFDENLHLKENFSQKLYASSSVTLLEAVFQHFYVFSTNNGMSKSAMSNALQTEKSHLPQPNSLPPTFKEAKSLIKPLLMPLTKV
ncbi:Hypothetical predicted protein [Mytilus galloprovincialis]|uniref:Uncharacterized protein n=1 Tax=Mytilus galloprovincialis TaxID=29158 RepID=A0A8B6BRE2_MYTGA|nr:Hypothetical predicted protein [Mytilus galloprovincialis]